GQRRRLGSLLRAPSQRNSRHEIQASIRLFRHKLDLPRHGTRRDRWLPERALERSSTDEGRLDRSKEDQVARAIWPATKPGFERRANRAFAREDELGPRATRYRHGPA